MKKGLIGDILKYNVEIFKFETQSAIDVFFEDREDVQKLLLQEDVNMLFNEWLVFDYRLSNGKSLVENYLKNNFDNLSLSDSKECNSLLKNIYSLFKIERVWKEKGLFVKDLVSGRQYDVKEKSMTRNVNIGDITFLRLVQFDGVYEIVGGTTKAISNFDIDERITAEWKDESMTPKDMFTLMYSDNKKENSVEDEMKDRWNEELDPQKAKEEFEKVLEKNNLDKFVSVSVVQNWIENMGTKEAVVRDINDIVDIFANLSLKDGEIVDVSEEFIIALSNLINTTKQMQLGGKSSQEKKSEDPELEPDFQTSIRQVGNNESTNHFNKVIEFMKDEKYESAIKESELGAIVAIENRDVFEFEYRILANYAVCLLGEEKYELAIKFLKMSLDLNSNYGFAQNMLTKAQNVAQAEELESLREKMAKNTEYMHDPQEVQNKWSEKKILDKLISIGVHVDKDELMEFLREDLSAERYWKTRLLPQLKKSKLSDNRWDEDLLWMSTYALWKKYKNDDDLLNEHLFNIMTNITEECENDDLDYKELENYFEEAMFYLEKAPDEVIKEITKYNIELLSFVNALIWLLQDIKCVDKVYEVTRAIAKKTNNELFKLFDILKKIENGDEWKNDYHKIVSKNKYCISIHIFIADFLGYQCGYKEIEEEILINALDVVKLREKDKKWDVDCYSSNTVYDDYITVIEHLDDLYIETEKKQKERELNKFRDAIDSREGDLAYSPRNDKMDEELEKMKSETKEMQKINKLLDGNPMKKYYDFLKKTKINFVTEEMTEDVINVINSKKVGRNKPCPCGSGKKYKNCCL